MKNTTQTLIVSSAIAIALMVPRTAQAGKSEWATAGKILAGVTAYHVLSGSSSGSCREEVRVTERVYTGHRHPSEYGRYYRSETVHRNPRSYGRSHGHSPKVARCGGCHKVQSSCSCGPVIIEISECRRLMQPRIRGHRSYLQSWDSCRGEWLTVGVRKSIW